MSDEHEKVIKEVVKYQGPVFDVVTKTISTDHGTITRDVCVHHGDSVAVAVFIPDGYVLVSKEYRAGDQEESWGLPAGMQEPGETPTQTALRELKEELGIDLKGTDQESIEDIGYISSSAGFVQEKVHVVCIDLSYEDYTEGATNWDKDEFINSHKFINYQDALDWMKESQDDPSEDLFIMDSRFYVAVSHRLQDDLESCNDALEDLSGEYQELYEEYEDMCDEELDSGAVQMDEKYTKGDK